MSRRLCPKCKSEDIAFHGGGITGLYRCKKCGYIGPLIIEEDLKNLDINQSSAVT